MYRKLLPPFEVIAFEDMNKKQVERYFNWFMEKKDERIQYLQEYINKDRNIALDRSPESLITLWEWFEDKVEWVPKTQEDYERQMINRPEWMRVHIYENPYKLSEETVRIAMDIAVYFGETLIKNHPSVYWGYVMKPKKLHGVKRPVLRGFQGNECVYPYTLISVCIRRSSKVRNREELFETYQIWEKHV